MKSYIFIDGSYFIYHRYFSLIRWWKLSNPESYLDDNQTYFSQNTIFVDKFKKIFLESIHSLPKKFNQLGSTIIVGKDFKKENIWRKQYYQEYKEHKNPELNKKSKILQSRYREGYQILCKLIKDNAINSSYQNFEEIKKFIVQK